MAGYESYVPDPEYVSLDLAIDVCATDDAFAADVKEAIVAALAAAPGFFAPDNFSFGQPLERSALETAIQAVSGRCRCVVHPCAGARAFRRAGRDGRHGRRRQQSDHTLRQ